MKKLRHYFLLAFLIIPGFSFCSNSMKDPVKDGISIENAELRLVIGRDGKALSLLHKPSGQECLQPENKRANNASVFSITEYRPYNGELQLAYPAKSKTYEADSVYRVGNDLIVSFELINIVATIRLKITDDYIGFILKKLDHVKGFGDNTKFVIDELTILQLPVRDREYFGEWLNVIWDKDVAVNVLGTDQYSRIDAVKYKGYHLLQATAVGEVKTLEVGAALITTGKNNLLSRIDHLERDFNLPRGVESRRSKEYKYSYFWLSDVTPQNIDEWIAIAKKGGFRTMVIYYPAFAKTMGHFPWRPEYPNGIADLQTVTRKIKDAGMIPGFHIHYNKVSKEDFYVSPVPDHRLNLRSIFTLAAPLKKESTTITVEESPKDCTMDNGRRILKIGNELIEYLNYTTDAPYQFTGCRRGVINTNSSEYGLGYKLGLLDVDSWPVFVRVDQKTSIQQEIAERIGKIYKEAGFQFVYFDGAEDVHPPYWFNVSSAQLKVYNCLKPAPLFSEGACKSHFSWHILTRGNAFDVFSPEVIKEATRKHPATEAEKVAQDFTSINFGWLDYIVPSKKTIGMQPDMYEYICSRATAWDCPISLRGKMDAFKTHPRTNDNLEVIRRWEEARINNFFSDEQKKALQNLDQENILLINETGGFELQPYKQIQDAAGGNPAIRAFMFDRSGKTYIVFWHPSGEGNLELNIDASKIHLYKELGKEIPVKKNNNGILVSYGDRQYFEIDLSKERVLSALRDAKILK